MTKMRLLVVGAVLGASILGAAAPASATCRPERPETCEVEGFPPDYSCQGEIVLPDGSSYSFNLC